VPTLLENGMKDANKKSQYGSAQVAIGLAPFAWWQPEIHSRRPVMFQSISILRNAVLAAALLAVAATPAFAQRGYRGGYQDSAGRYHGGNQDFGYPYNGGYYPAYGYYPSDPVLLSRPYSYSYGTPSYSVPSQSFYYTPASTTPDNSATVQVRVPAYAQLWFDDTPTKQTGTSRSFYTPQLDPGKAFKYTIRAQWEEDGKKMEKTKEIEVRAGQQTDVDFMRQ
jgi:uncharacterized protein (TIGR03000 family)